MLVRQLADRAGLTVGLSAALPSPLGSHDRGRVFAAVLTYRLAPTGCPSSPAGPPGASCNDETTYDAPGGWIMPYGLRGV